MWVVGHRPLSLFSLYVSTEGPKGYYNLPRDALLVRKSSYFHFTFLSPMRKV